MLNRDFERASQGLKPLKRQFVECQTCGSNWFDRVEAIRVDLNQMNNLGSQVGVSGGPFHLLKCLRCHDLQEPPLTSTQMSPLRTEYDNLLDQVKDNEGDTRGTRPGDSEAEVDGTDGSNS